jgi:hypothetical protein
MAEDVQIRFGADASAALGAITELRSALDDVAPALDRMNATYLRTFRSTMQILVDLKQVSTQRALALDLEYTARLHEQDRERLLAFIDANSEMTGERLSTLFRLAELDTQYTATAADNQRRLGDQARSEAARIAASYERAFDQLGSSVQRSFNEMATGQTTWAAGSMRLVQRVESFFLEEIETMAAKWAASGLANLAGGGVDAAVKGAQAAGGTGLGAGLMALVGLNQPGGLFGSGLFAGTGGAAQATALTANTTALAANTTAMATLTAALTGATVASGGAAAAGTIGAAGSVAGGAAAASGGGFFSWLGGLFAFARGGIVPSAAGGWVLPNFTGATPALLHAREMVLPAPISEGLQAMIGGTGGGAAHFHAHFHGPADAPAISRWFRDNMRANAGAIRDMFRQNALTPRTL